MKTVPTVLSQGASLHSKTVVDNLGLEHLSLLSGIPEDRIFYMEAEELESLSATEKHNLLSNAVLLKDAGQLEDNQLYLYSGEVK